MKKKISKNLILEACIKKQEELIMSFESRVSEMKDDAFSKNHSSSQTEDRKTGKIELLRNFEKELAFVRMEMDLLKSLNPDKINSKVDLGAVVITDKMNFFIAVSSEKVEIDGETFFGISTKAPIYSVMLGLEKNDKFEFNSHAYIIEEIY